MRCSCLRSPLHHHLPVASLADHALLVDDLDGERHDSPVWLRRLPFVRHPLDDVNRVMHLDGRPEFPGQPQHGEGGAVLDPEPALQPSGDGETRWAVQDASTEGGPPGELLVRVDRVEVSGKAGEDGEVRLRDRAAGRLEAVAQRQLFEVPPHRPPSLPPRLLTYRSVDSIMSQSTRKIRSGQPSAIGEGEEAMSTARMPAAPT